MIKRLRARYRKWRQRQAIRRIRDTLTALGVDVSGLTAEEVARVGVQRFARVAAAMHVAAEEANANLIRFGEAMREAKRQYVERRVAQGASAEWAEKEYFYGRLK